MQGVSPISLSGRAPMPPAMGMGARPAGLPAIVGGGTAVGRTVGGLLGIAGGTIMVAPTIIDQFGNEKKLRVTRRLRSQVKRSFFSLTI